MTVADPFVRTDDDSSDHPPRAIVNTARVGGWDQNETRFLNRELSWLAFNARVLQLVEDRTTPLLERAAFLAIFASNLDEFFQVRVSGLHDQVAAGIAKRTADGRLPSEQLAEIRDVVVELTERHQRLFLDSVQPALSAEGIELMRWDDLAAAEQAEMSAHFEARIYPVITPLAVDPLHPFPYVSDLSLNLAVLLESPDGGNDLFARLKVPNTLPRWLPVGDGYRFVAIEEVISVHLDQLFPGMTVLEHHAFRVTRNADLSLDEGEADDLLAAVEMELRRRRFGRSTRLEVNHTMSSGVLDLLLRELDLEPADVYTSVAPLDATSLFAIAGIDIPDFHWPDWHGVTEIELQNDVDDPRSIFNVLRRGDVLLHHPYTSFSTSVVEFIHQAARDPSVLAIKLTLYRTSGDSPIIDALVAASERGKQVAVLVELKARFDEEANIGWAKRLETAGVHVAYGLAGLKIHTKVAMVVREEGDGIRRYCHIGTGNYNPRTARIYEDFGLLTADAQVGADAANLFNFLTGYGRNISYDRLLIAPDHLRQGLIDLIDTEIAADSGRIIMKMNSLVDQPMIEKLYEASQTGVEIDLLVRGICCLRPCVPGMSSGIRVRSIVGRYLEHSRIYHFANGAGPGESATYIGSADLMGRNLNRRVEALVRVDDEALVDRLLEAVDVGLRDDRLAWTLDEEGSWTREWGPVGVDSHVELQALARARSTPPSPTS